MAFYLDVYSKSEFFTSNRAGNFRAQIHPAKTLKGRWEVSLVEARLPHALNLQEDAPYIQTFKNLEGETILLKKLTIPKGYYTSYEELKYKLKIVGLTFNFDAVMNKVAIKIDRKYEIMFLEELAAILGLVPNETYKTFVWAPDTVDVDRYITPMYLQSSIIPSQIVGESRRPVLRTIYQNGGHIEFSPKYIEVTDTTLDDLHFRITDKNNRELEFVNDNVNLTLHFRPCSQD